MTDDETGFTSRFIRARDGLRLHLRDYSASPSVATAMVCLPGLTRNAADFHEVALALSSDTDAPRRVLALDYRGRGLSDHDPKWSNYDVRIEADDVMSVLAALGVERAVFLGTSRGGLVTMALSAMRPGLIRGAILNDIGPVIEAKGLIRIRSYVGKLPQPRNYDEAADILIQVSGAQFPALERSDWMTMARRGWNQSDGRMVLRYDPALMKPLAALDLEAPMPDLWPLFAGLSEVPVLAIRGENSDLLSAATLAAMAARHPQLTPFSIAGQGHAPLLTDLQSIRRIGQFAASVDAA